MTIYILRAIWHETYECPEEGRVNVCEKYNDIKISKNREILDDMSENLNRGHVGYWSEKRANELRQLYGEYDTFQDARFEVVDVSDIVL